MFVLHGFRDRKVVIMRNLLDLTYLQSKSMVVIQAERYHMFNSLIITEICRNTD